MLPIDVTPDGIAERIEAINPVAYARTRNHVNGAVTGLSPLLSHGAVDPRSVARVVIERWGIDQCEKLIFELAWRDYFQHVWWERGHGGMCTELRQPQELVLGEGVPCAIVEARTGMAGIDAQLRMLVEHGLMHNHARMWVASLCSVVGRAPWLDCAEWMHYHLLDGDLGSNHGSWQWVVGTSRSGRYVADQHNVDRFGGHSAQAGTGTISDRPYEVLGNESVPEVLLERGPALLATGAPPEESLTGPVRTGEAVRLYHPHTLEAGWRTADTSPRGGAARRILVIEPSFRALRPYAQQRWDHIARLAAQIPQLEVAHCEAADLPGLDAASSVHWRLHPYTRDWPGEGDRRLLLLPEAEPRGLQSFSSWYRHAKGHVAQLAR